MFQAAALVMCLYILIRLLEICVTTSNRGLRVFASIALVLALLGSLGVLIGPPLR